jgi:hypothetical protein
MSREMKPKATPPALSLRTVKGMHQSPRVSSAVRARAHARKSFDRALTGLQAMPADHFPGLKTIKGNQSGARRRKAWWGR